MTAPPAATWSYPTDVRFGPGRIAELAEACRAAGMDRPLLVTDRGLAALPPVARALDLLEGAGLGLGLFAEVDPNPDEGNLAAGLAAWREGGHDGVVALGGGSALDLGKLVAMMQGQSRPVWDFEDGGDGWRRADARAIAPVVAVPTTAGKGSQVGRAGVLTRSEMREKKIVFHPRLLPATAILDPELTVGLPPWVTAGTGMDALAHCLEAFCSSRFHPMSHGIALEGMRLVLGALPRAFAEGADLATRADMMAAAAMAAVAFQKGLGAIHAVSHPVGAVYGTHHGTTNAVMMGPVLAFNRAEIEPRVERAAAYLGIGDGFDGFRAAVADLHARLGLPSGLAAMGVEEARVEALAAMALRDPSAGGNPRAMTLQNTAELIRAAL